MKRPRFSINLLGPSSSWCRKPSPSSYTWGNSLVGSGPSLAPSLTLHRRPSWQVLAFLWNVKTDCTHDRSGVQKLTLNSSIISVRQLQIDRTETAHWSVLFQDESLGEISFRLISLWSFQHISLSTNTQTIDQVAGLGNHLKILLKAKQYKPELWLNSVLP